MKKNCSLSDVGKSMFFDLHDERYEGVLKHGMYLILESNINVLGETGDLTVNINKVASVLGIAVYLAKKKRLTVNAAYRLVARTIVCLSVFGKGKDSFRRDNGIDFVLEQLLSNLFTVLDDSDYSIALEVCRMLILKESDANCILSQFEAELSLWLESSDSVPCQRHDHLPNKEEYLLKEGTPSFSDPIAVNEVMTHHVIGQPELCRQISMDVSYVSLMKERKLDFSPLCRLVISSTGSGKSFSFEVLEKHLHWPFVKVYDLSRYSEAGYRGGDTSALIKDILKHPYHIIVLDEFDKKVRVSFDSSGVNSNFAVLSELNTFLTTEGKNIVVYALGAFSEIRQKKKALKERAIGFASCNNRILSETSTETITYHDLINYGMPQEICGRFSGIIQGRDLSLNDFRQIFNNPGTGVLARLEERAALYNKQLVISKEFAEECVLTAYQKREDQGVRSMFGELEIRFCNLLFSAIQNKEGKITMDNTTLFNINKEALYVK